MSSPSAAFVPTAEAAFIAGLTDREMNRVVDEHILPESLIEQSNGRLFARLGAAFARFYFSTEKVLVADFRRKVLLDITCRLVERPEKDLFLGLRIELPKEISWLVIGRELQIDLASYVLETRKRMREVERAQNVVRTDPEVMSGEPVFAGTRVPIDIVLASVKEGVTPERLRASYPSVTDELIEAAKLYARIHPRRGRPKRLAEAHPEWKVKARKVVRPASKT